MHAYIQIHDRSTAASEKSCYIIVLLLLFLECNRAKIEGEVSVTPPSTRC